VSVSGEPTLRQERRPAYDGAVPRTDELLGRVSQNPAIGPGQRLFFAAVGLAAGDSVLLLLLLYMAMPDLGIFFWYAMFSVLGWVLLGVPIALAFPVRLLLRLTWPVRLVIGAAIGPLALLMIFAALFATQGKLGEFSLAHTDGLWFFSSLVSTVSFVVYTSLVLRHFSKIQVIKPLR
jgi:hypothetical protein